jgi:hypothetical protein
MPDAPTDFNELISMWPNPGLLASDLGRPYETIVNWKRRKSIPTKYWNAIVKSAQKHGIPGVTAETFLRLIP